MKRIFAVVFLVIWAGNLFAGGEPEVAAPAAEVNTGYEVFSVDVAEVSVIRLKASGLPADLTQAQFFIEPGTPGGGAQRSGAYVLVKTDSPMKMGTEYTLTVSYAGKTSTHKVNTAVLASVSLSGLYSEKPLGYNLENGKSVFRVFIPQGKKADLVIFNQVADPVEAARIIPLTADENQVFEATVEGTFWGKFYGYRITERMYTWVPFVPMVASDTVFADPYGRANAQSTTFPQKNRTLILDTSKYNWEGDKPLGTHIANAVIMEAHIRDLTADPTAGTATPGYKGMVNATRGGLKWIKDLGVNTVEFLPLQEFAEVEPPYKVLAAGMKNTWNIYGRNYWGYMTSNYFSPESSYASDATRDPARWNGADGRAVTELKDMVKALHKAGVAVVMDVVYNHTSSYDENSFRIMDRDYFFKKVDKTGTGNEMESRRLMVRRMMLDSLKYWMTEYHVDGFRFDLATSHDKDTVKAVADLVYSINPQAMLIAEPWGGENSTISRDLLNAGWAIWNDGVRKAIRNDNRPTTTRPMFALGSVNVPDELKNAWAGTSASDNFQSWQMVSYIESHDDATFGDILRISSGAYNIYQADGKTINRIADIPGYLKLDDKLINSAKVGAVALFLSQGPLMMHIGQEWARGKITPDLTGMVQELTTKGTMGGGSDNVAFLTPSPNSYSADNETNWINFDHARLNQSLTDYYKGLLKLRQSQPLLGAALPKQVTLMEDAANPKALGTAVAGKIYGFINADPQQVANFTLPSGSYEVMVDQSSAGTKVLRTLEGGPVTVAPQSGLVLLKKGAP